MLDWSQLGSLAQWEPELKGYRGGRQVEADAAGRQLKILREIPPEPGQNLVLTLDTQLQLQAERALEGKAGAIVAMDPNTGDILAMASSPAFDQNQFVGRVEQILSRIGYCVVVISETIRTSSGERIGVRRDGVMKDRSPSMTLEYDNSTRLNYEANISYNKTFNL